MSDTDASHTPETETTPDLTAEANANAEMPQMNETRLVPVSEAIRYRKRAQTAEQELKRLQDELGTVHTELAQAREAIDQIERRHQVDELLAKADPIDMEAVRLLTMAAIEGAEDPDLESVIADLQSGKPLLFRQPNKKDNCAAVGSARSPSIPMRGRSHARTLHEAGRQAALTGRRDDVLRYMRVRRDTNNGRPVA